MSTQTPPSPGADVGPRVSAEEARDLARLRRTTSGAPQGRYLAGVAGGIARHLDIDPLVVRVALVVLLFFGGAGLLLYAAGWLLVPEEGAAHAPIRLDDRTRTIVLWVVAALAALAVVGDSLGRFHLPWPLVIIGLVVLWILTRRRPKDGGWPVDQRTAAGPTTAAPGPAATSDLGAPVDLTKPTTSPYDAEAPTTGAYGPAGASVPAGPTAYRRPDPRKTGPILFWFTLALVALAMGVLGIIDVAGATLHSASYPAVALGLIGAMLVVGAFVGRAGGLIALGLVATIALVGAGVGDHLGARRSFTETPTSAAAVAPAYHVGAGRITLDLSQVRDLPALGGRRISVSANVGELELIVPPGLGVDFQARVRGPGNIRTFGEDHGGINTVYDHLYAGSPVVTLVADLKAGQIELREPNPAPGLTNPGLTNPGLTNPGLTNGVQR